MRKVSSSLWLLLFVGSVYLASWYLGSPQAEELPAAPTPAVSDAELETYIAVYKAMQEDHGIDIEDAVRTHSMDLETFRALERRIQANPRLVEKVREELLAFARARSALALSVATPTAPPTPRSAQPHKKKKQ
jgi:hypothetical protein